MQNSFLIFIFLSFSQSKIIKNSQKENENELNISGSNKSKNFFEEGREEIKTLPMNSILEFLFIQKLEYQKHQLPAQGRHTRFPSLPPGAAAKIIELTPKSEQLIKLKP